MRLAQLTDLHARAAQPGTSRAPARRSREMMDRLEAALNALADHAIDLLAVTGDLLDVPDYILDHDDYHDYDRAAWLAAAEADYRALRRLLEASGRRWTALPGNHDHQATFARVFPEEPELEVAGWRVISFRDRDHYAHVPRRFGRERLRLDAVLSDADPRPQIHLQHFVLTPELNEHWPHTYLEGAELTRRLAESGRVRLSLSGHYHDGTELLRHGGCVFTTAPAFCLAPHPVRIYELTGETVEMTTLELAPAPRPLRPAVFLDRDGTLNEEGATRGGPAGIVALPGAAAATRLLRAAGYVLVLVSNQSTIGRGYASPEMVDSHFDRLHRELAAAGGGYDAWLAAAGAGPAAVHPCWAATDDRKPAPALVERAARLLDLDLNRSWLIGDRLDDLGAARAAGVRPILVRTGFGRETEPLAGAAPVVDDVLAAARWILGADPRA